MAEQVEQEKLDAARWGDCREKADGLDRKLVAMAAQAQAAQDARDRLLELNTMLVIRALYATGGMNRDLRAVADRAESAIDDLRYHTGRDGKGHRA